MNNKIMSINWKMLAVIVAALMIWSVIAISHIANTRTATHTTTMQWQSDTCWGYWELQL